MKNLQYAPLVDRNAPIWRRSVRTALVGVFCATVTVCAEAAPHFPSSEVADELPQPRQICQGIIQVQPGEDRFNSCISTLDDSRRGAITAQAVAAARDACFQQLHKRGIADLNVCLLRAADAKSVLGDKRLLSNGSDIADGEADDLDSSRSFYAISSDTKFRRERRACALLGLDPAFSAFSSCVSDLQDVLQIPTTD